ncbi:hypothetical protein [Agaribacter marinus]|uniref:Outer membrane protein beta-barrel domain-containing protein n=1 Tax=Agaribacter marinus TaxID=1431249 RepID=A0AA37WIT1_9ALTE|nr:hypothetical protein [Agaribacter marinus]GLR72151.1 hypothetical protein GCM10007852_30590 [Agaribacter marinus]
MRLLFVVSSLFLLILFSAPSFAHKYETSVGVGHQYGGLLGVKVAYKSAQTKYYGALGLVGVSVGMQTTFSKGSKHTYGFTLGREELQSEDGFLFVTYDYHFNGFQQEGFVIGTGLGITREDDGGFLADKGDIETSTSATLTLAYKF